MSSSVGGLGVSVAIQKLTSEGFQISIPFVDMGYDLVTDHNGYLRRLQVKSTLKKGNQRRKYKFNCVHATSPYTEKECDAVMYVGLDTASVFIVPVSLAPGKTAYLGAESPHLNNYSVLRKPG